MATGVAVIMKVCGDIYPRSWPQPSNFEFHGPTWWLPITERGQAGTKAGRLAARNACCERKTAPDLICAGLMNQEYLAFNQVRSVANRPVFVSPVASFSSQEPGARSYKPRVRTES